MPPPPPPRAERPFSIAGMIAIWRSADDMHFIARVGTPGDARVEADDGSNGKASWSNADPLGGLYWFLDRVMFILVSLCVGVWDNLDWVGYLLAENGWQRCPPKPVTVLLSSAT